jgi:hypothetical protein
MTSGRILNCLAYQAFTIISGFQMDEQHSYIKTKVDNFVQALHPALRDVAYDKGTYLGSSLLGTRVEDFPRSISSICTLPLLFGDVIPVAAGVAQEISYSFTIGILYGLLTDKIIDQQLSIASPHILLLTSLAAEYFHSLESLLQPYPGFWRHHQRFIRQYQTAELAHAQLIHHGSFDLSRYKKLARAKSAWLKVSVTALAYLADTPSLALPFMASIDHFLVGFQLHDDVMDWKEDFIQRRVTPVTVRIPGFTPSSQREGYNDPGRVELDVHSSDVLESTLDLSSHCFEDARKEVTGNSCFLWNKYLDSMIDANNLIKTSLVQTKIETMLTQASRVDSP